MTTEDLIIESLFRLDTVGRRVLWMNLSYACPDFKVIATRFFNASTFEEIRRALQGFTPEMLEELRYINEHPKLQFTYRTLGCFN